MPYQRPRTQAVILPLHRCPSCGREHPKPKGTATGSDSPFLNSAQLAGFLGVAVATIHSKKSRGELPPTLLGRKSPLWDSCVAAAFLHTGSLNTEK